MDYSSLNSEQQIQSFLSVSGCQVPDEVLARIRVLTLHQRDVLLKKGDSIHNVYIILKGQFTVSEAWSNGTIFIFTELGPEDFICELECYQQNWTAQFNIICKQDAVLLSLPVDSFLAWQAVDPVLCQMLIQSLIRKLGSSARTASQMPIASGIVKLTRFLIGYCQHNDIAFLPEVTVALTREELSYNLGLSVRTINRLLQNLKAKQAVSIQSGKIHITQKQFELLLCLAPDNETQK